MIDSPDFGVCSKCSAPIHIARPESIPTTKTYISCSVC